MMLQEIQRELGVDAAMALRIQRLLRRAFAAGFTEGRYIDPEFYKLTRNDCEQALNDWLSQERCDAETAQQEGGD